MKLFANVLLLILCVLSTLVAGQEPVDQHKVDQHEVGQHEVGQRGSTANPFLTQGASDNGWSHIRGANFDGHSHEINLADAWPEDGPPVLWVKELGQGYSSIVVQNDRAYTQYQSLAGQFVICMDAFNGDTIWRYRYDWPFEATGLYPGPRSTPTIYDHKVYFQHRMDRSVASAKVGNFSGRMTCRNNSMAKAPNLAMPVLQP